MKRRLSFLITTLFCLWALSACGHEHTWRDADCDTPQTCSECGETEGEPLGHDYAPATCEDPEKCTRCGETRGQAKGHDISGSTATYDHAAVCSVCGSDVGEPLSPDFVLYGLDERMIALGETVPYVTTCYQNPSCTTTGEAAVIAYTTFDSDEAHADLDGYEWRKITWEVTFSDQNANDYGFSVASCSEDYYDIKLRDDSAVQSEDEEGVTLFTCSYGGEMYDQCLIEWSDWSWGEWEDGVITGTLTSYVRVPKGYDGAVVGLRNSSVEWGDGEYIFDVADNDTIFFRLD